MPVLALRSWPDVEDIKFVINFDYPASSEDYVHRIGRTGRSTNTGTAYTFFTPANGKQATELVKVLREANQVVSPKLLQLEESHRGMRGGRSRWRGRDGGFGGHGGRFSSGGGGSRGSSSYGSSRSNFSSSNGTGGYKSQGNAGSGGFKSQSFSNGFMNNSKSLPNGKPFQNGTSATNGFNTQWNKGGVTAASLASIQPPPGPPPQKY